jgi:hypothetical protein
MIQSFLVWFAPDTQDFFKTLWNSYFPSCECIFSNVIVSDLLLGWELLLRCGHYGPLLMNLFLTGRFCVNRLIWSFEYWCFFRFGALCGNQSWSKSSSGWFLATNEIFVSFAACLDFTLELLDFGSVAGMKPWWFTCPYHVLWALLALWLRGDGDTLYYLNLSCLGCFSMLSFCKLLVLLLVCSCLGVAILFSLCLCVGALISLL